MKYNYLIIGSGMMGEAIAYDLLQNIDTKLVRVVDKDKSRIEILKNKFAKINFYSKLEFDTLDASDYREVARVMGDIDVAVGAAGYNFNETLTKAAINTHTHFCDLGGNNTVVENQFKLSDIAKNYCVSIIPDCGIAPGAVSTLVAYGIENIGIPKEIHIRVGGLPQHPQGILQYMKVFSIEGLINEYIEPVEVLENGKITIKTPLIGLEPINFFDKRFSDGKLELEAAYTSGGSSTLAKTLESKVEVMDYKTIRYKGHFEKIRTLHELGYFCKEQLTGFNTTPRALSEKIINDLISYDDEDMILLRVSLENGKKKLQYDLVDFQNKTTGHTAMQRTTGYSAAIVAAMLARGDIKENGVLKIEESIPPKPFIDEWKKRGLILKETNIS